MQDEDKIPYVSGLVNKTDYSAKTSDIGKKYILFLLIIANVQKKYLMQK